MDLERQGNLTGFRELGGNSDFLGSDVILRGSLGSGVI